MMNLDDLKKFLEHPELKELIEQVGFCWPRVSTGPNKFARRDRYASEGNIIS
nr:hypothetical protein KXZ65_02870 [Pectobacterium sp. PL152]